MRVALDARYLQADYSGIGVYSKGLITALSDLDQENEYFVFVHSSYRDTLDLGENFEIIEDNSRPISVRSISTIGTTFRRYGIDMLHSLFPLVPLLWKGKVISTIHDLQALLDPKFTARRSAIQRAVYDGFYKFSYPASMYKADYLVSDSYATKDFITQNFPALSDKVLVIHGGVPAQSFDTPSEAETLRVKEKFNLPDKFLFYLGSTRPNKNLDGMLDAFEEFIRRHPEHDDLYWVMVVKPDRFFDPIFARIRERNLLQRIHIHEQVSELEKRVLYRLASLLYFVSKYEGFGLPVLEAQAAQLPVMASTHAALPEVAGSSAILCDADDRDSIVGGLETYFNDPTLRGQMVAAGLENVKRFSWEKSAKEVLDMYNHLLG